MHVVGGVKSCYCYVHVVLLRAGLGQLPATASGSENFAFITVFVFVVNVVQPITFADFFVGDILTSMAKVGDLMF